MPDGEPWAVCPPVAPDCPDDAVPGAPPAEDAPLGSEVDADVPAEPEVCEALPDGWLEELVLLLGRLPEPLELDEEEEDGEEEGDDDPEDGDPPEDGMPLDDLLEEEEVAQPAVTSSRPTAATVAARCNCAATTGVTRSIGPAPSGMPMSRF